MKLTILAAVTGFCLCGTANAGPICDPMKANLMPEQLKDCYDWERNWPAIKRAREAAERAREAAALQRYGEELVDYGPRAVAECRSRTYLNLSQYQWCLEAQKGR